LFDWGIQAVGSEGGKEGHFNGEKVLINVNAQFDVSSDITIFYMHLTLRDEIIAMVRNSPNNVKFFEAGTHIGYMYWPPPSSYYSLDFGVLDRNVNSELTHYPKHFLNIRANPLDYFTDELRKIVLEAYQETYDTLVEKGVTPYSDIEDSRANFNIQDEIWGLWFKDDLLEAWDGSAWSIITLVKNADLHQETYWKTFEEFPTMAGLFVEQSTGEVVGKPLYEGQPLRRSKFHILSGNDRVGVARIGEDRGKNPRTIFLKYEVQPNKANKFDDKLIMESFDTLEEAMTGQFSGKALLFNREPCNSSIHTCS